VPRAVTVGRFGEDGATITAGLAPGEPVIVTGQRRLATGQAVQARSAPPPALQR
jgi:multidrug efflux pump subunit AcrA (membrane-fusion protein)